MLKPNSCTFSQCVNYEAESTPKIELLLRQIECRIAESVFVESQLVQPNHIYNFPFVSSNRVSFGEFVFGSTILVSVKPKFPFFLSSGLAFCKFCSVFPRFFDANYHFNKYSSQTKKLGQPHHLDSN